MLVNSSRTQEQSLGVPRTARRACDPLELGTARARVGGDLGLEDQGRAWPSATPS